MSSASKGSPRASDDRDGVISPLRFLSGGLEFAATCALGALLGRWIDARLGTDPWFTAVLLIVSFATATWMLLKSLRNLGAEPDSSDEGNRS